MQRITDEQEWEVHVSIPFEDFSGKKKLLKRINHMENEEQKISQHEKEEQQDEAVKSYVPKALLNDNCVPPTCYAWAMNKFTKNELYMKNLGHVHVQLLDKSLVARTSLKDHVWLQETNVENIKQIHH